MAFKLGCSQATDSPCKAAALCRSCCWPPRQGRRPWPSPWVGHRWVLPWPTVFFPCWHLPDSWAQQCFLSHLRFLVPAQLLDSPGCLSCSCSPAFFKPWPQFLPALLLVSSSQQRPPGTSEFSRKNRCKLLPINLLYDVITRMIKPSKQLSVAEYKYTLRQPRHRARDSCWPTSLFFSHFYRCCLPHPQDAFTSKRCHMI